MSRATDEPRISRIINFNTPFGPNESENVGEDNFEIIFDRTTAAAIQLKDKPSLVVGRRGAGKTAILQSIKHRGTYELVVEVPSLSRFDDTLTLLEKGAAELLLPEKTIEIWYRTLWLIVFSEVAKKYLKKRPVEALKLQKYVANISGSKKSVFSYLTIVARLWARNASKDNVDGLDEALQQLLSLETDFEDCVKDCKEILNSQKAEIALLFDNLEKLNLAHDRISATMAGLIGAISKFRNPDIPCDVYCCIPAELYPTLVRQSFNVEKHLSSRILLQWRNHDLMHVAAIRYRKFLELNAPASVFQQIEHFDLDITENLNKFFLTILPKTIVNGVGVEEYTLRYLFRHTQMLPRQFLAILNEISSTSLLENRENFFFSSASIVRGVNSIEHRIAEGILSGFSTVYPDARLLCETVLPNLTHRFTVNEFEKTFRRNLSSLSHLSFNARSALDVLLEMGIIGVHVKDAGDYLVAEYAYALPHRLHYKQEDRLFVHPIFWKEYRISPKSKDGYKPVVAKGLDVDFGDFEEI
jgi:hypothetical protein